jgi:hypothetical protein
VYLRREGSDLKEGMDIVDCGLPEPSLSDLQSLGDRARKVSVRGELIIETEDEKDTSELTNIPSHGTSSPQWE